MTTHDTRNASRNKRLIKLKTKTSKIHTNNTFRIPFMSTNKVSVSFFSKQLSRSILNWIVVHRFRMAVSPPNTDVPKLFHINSLHGRPTAGQRPTYPPFTRFYAELSVANRRSCTPEYQRCYKFVRWGIGDRKDWEGLASDALVEESLKSPTRIEQAWCSNLLRVRRDLWSAVATYMMM
uniref:SFRICE_018614 n=1 Tax=Spodoptera frugiperda TaxID=7108 RepID=A0A2H1VF32_SPOFR